MARPRNADGQRTRQAILDAALDLFADKGYFGTSLRDVAAVVGVRESALYNYFPGKEALFDALLTAFQEHSAVEQLALPDGPIADGHALLVQLAEAMLDGFAEPRAEKLFRILMSDGLRLAKDGRINLYERMGHRRERLHDLLRRMIRDGWLRREDLFTLGMSFVGPLLMWRQLRAINADLPMIRNPRAFARRHVDQFLDGAAARRSIARRLPSHTASRRRSS